MTDQLRRAAGVVVLALVLLLLGLLGGRDEPVGGTMYAVGLLLLVASLVAVAILLVRGDRRPKHTDRD